MKTSLSFSYWAVTTWFASVVFALEATLGTIAAGFSPSSVLNLLLYWYVLIRSEWECEVCNCPWQLRLWHFTSFSPGFVSCIEIQWQECGTPNKNILFGDAGECTEM